MGGDIHILSSNPDLVSRFGGLAGAAQTNGAVYAVTRTERLAPGGTALLVVVDLDTAGKEIYQQIQQFRADGGRSWLAVTSQSATAEQLLDAMRAGANDFLRPDGTAEELREVLRRAAGAVQPDASRGPSGGLVVGVFSNKGGVGTTTIAINVAGALARRTAGSVVLVDLVLQHGDIGTLLDTPSVYTVAHLAREVDRADASYLKSAISKHPSGLFVLPAPAAADEAESVTGTMVSRIVTALRGAFDYVILDLANEFSDPTLAALDASDRILLLTLPDVPSVRNTRRGLELFERLRYEPSKTLLAVNRADAQGRMQQDTMETALGRPIQWSVPNDYQAVVQAVNQGTVIRPQPRGKRLAENLDLLVESHFRRGPAAAPTGPKPAPVQRLFRHLVKAKTHGTS